MSRFKIFVIFLVYLNWSQAAVSQNVLDQTSVEEIIVTATSRETKLIDVPYNISTVSGDEIEERAIFDDSELLRNFAGVSTVDRGYRNAGTTSNIRMRGLNLDSAALQDFPVSAVASVSTYMDNTPVFANFLLRDLSRVEVLRGPQGTLYGSGALGGTIRFITNKPQLEELSGSVTFTGSSVNESDGIGKALDVVFNIPFGEKAALRFVGAGLDYPGLTDYVNIYETGDIPDGVGVDGSTGVPVPRDGYGYPSFITSPPIIKSVNDADSVKVEFLRTELLLSPTDKFQMSFKYASQDDGVGGRRQSSVGPRYVLNTSCTALLDPDCFTQSTYGDYENGAVMLEPSERQVSMSAFELSYDGDLFDIEFTGSQYDRRGSSTTDNTGFFAKLGTYTSPIAGYYNQTVGGIWSQPSRPYAPAQRQYTNGGSSVEIRLISEPGDKFDYILGYFSQDEDQYRGQQTFIKGVNQWKFFYWGVDYIVDPNEQDFDYAVKESVENSAIYGEMAFHLTDEFDVVVGYRRFDVEADASMNMAFKLYDVGPALANTSNEDDGGLAKLNLSYQPENRDQHFFFTWSEGYRRGGVNAVPTSGTFPEEPGWVPFQSDSSTNLEIGVKGKTSSDLFYNVSLYSVKWDDPQLYSPTPTYSYYSIINGEEAETSGFDFELSGSFGVFDFSLGYAYNETDLSKDLLSPANSPVMLAEAGSVLPGSPKHMLNANIAHTHYFNSGWGIVNRADLYSQSKTTNVLSDSSTQYAEFGGFEILNVSSTLFQDDRYATIFIKNLFNERGTTGAFTNAAFGPDPSQGFYGSDDREFFALPRTLGIAINIGF